VPRLIFSQARNHFPSHYAWTRKEKILALDYFEDKWKNNQVEATDADWQNKLNG